MSIEIYPIRGIPEVVPGDDLAALIIEGLEASQISLFERDVLVITHKVVSKAEGRIESAPDDRAYRNLAEREARSILRRRGDLLIAQTEHGFICANAGVDRSNVADGLAVLLPVDPDRSAHRIRLRIERMTGVSIAVVVTDTFGRPWRRGLVDVAIGVSGLPAILDLRGESDAHGRTMNVTEIAIVDEIAAAADLVMGKADGIPAAVLRGLDLTGDGRATDLVRPPEEDMFR
ncbi:MAG: coenzyme F420-0:L-glutamate ligase [Actinomycetia bacterium]|jgi:coenzyme F420-0:L-glutamate ligase/coenzyme F420-1:gamma-L-glutamate ligase|nr:coenzyme F420-0:L-glutamate ligase [Actinomycetes bacterium]